MSVQSWGWCPTCRKTQVYHAEAGDPLACDGCGGGPGRTDPVDALLGLAVVAALILLGAAS